MRLILALILGVTIGYGGSLVQGHLFGPSANQPYADEQGRMISTLSSDDVKQLRNGEGWGLAKPAEFNGYPGPAHVLEFADKLALDETQLGAIKASFEAMKARAKALGEQYVAAEVALDDAFKSGAITRAQLEDVLRKAADVRGQLRAVHLNAHLEITPLLSDAQKTKYAELRGYVEDGHGGHGGH